MRQRAMVLLVLSLMSIPATSGELRCGSVEMAGTGVVSDKIVRYLKLSEDPCLMFQVLTPGGRGAIEMESKICAVEGKDLGDGYSFVDYRNGYFKGGKVFFEFKLFPLIPAADRVVVCEVVFVGERADHFKCKE